MHQTRIKICFPHFADAHTVPFNTNSTSLLLEMQDNTLRVLAEHHLITGWYNCKLIGQE
jgi:hypothetical protein